MTLYDSINLYSFFILKYFGFIQLIIQDLSYYFTKKWFLLLSHSLIHSFYPVNIYYLFLIFKVLSINLKYINLPVSILPNLFFENNLIQLITFNFNNLLNFIQLIFSIKVLRNLFFQLILMFSKIFHDLNLYLIFDLQFDFCKLEIF